MDYTQDCNVKGSARYLKIKIDFVLLFCHFKLDELTVTEISLRIKVTTLITEDLFIDDNHDCTMLSQNEYSSFKCLSKKNKYCRCYSMTSTCVLKHVISHKYCIGHAPSLIFKVLKSN